MLIEPDETSYRAVDKYRFADTTEILANTAIVDKEVRAGGGGRRIASSLVVLLPSVVRVLVIFLCVQRTDNFHMPRTRQRSRWGIATFPTNRTAVAGPLRDIRLDFQGSL